MNYIFLDIDGVLNHHDYNQVVESSTLDKDCVKEFNRIIEAVDPVIVISSAWRYMILNGAMTIKGFEYLLRTHGVNCKNRIIDITKSDEDVANRGQQILEWYKEMGEHQPYIVIDDGGNNAPLYHWCDLGIGKAGHPVVWTKSHLGLTKSDADIIIDFFK